jgi:hypothetical protein
MAVSNEDWVKTLRNAMVATMKKGVAVGVELIKAYTLEHLGTSQWVVRLTQVCPGSTDAMVNGMIDELTTIGFRAELDPNDQTMLMLSLPEEEKPVAFLAAAVPREKDEDTELVGPFMRECSVPGCGRTIRCRGLCESHYRKVRRHREEEEEEKPLASPSPTLAKAMAKELASLNDFSLREPESLNRRRLRRHDDEEEEEDKPRAKPTSRLAMRNPWSSIRRDSMDEAGARWTKSCLVCCWGPTWPVTR